jgi:hypothetical protein
MAYEVWDMQTGSLVASFRHQEEALALVRDAVEAHGEAYGLNLALVQEDEAGRTTTRATADQLLGLARIPA